MSGLFGDLDVQSAESNPFDIPDGTYSFYVKEVGDLKPTKDESKQGITFVCAVLEGEYEGRTLNLWQQIPTETQSTEGKRAASYLKRWLESLGVPEDRMNSVGRDDLIERKFTGVVKHNDGGYANLARHSAYVSAPATAATGAANPFGD